MSFEFALGATSHCCCHGSVEFHIHCCGQAATDARQAFHRRCRALVTLVEKSEAEQPAILQLPVSLVPQDKCQENFRPSVFVAIPGSVCLVPSAPIPFLTGDSTLLRKKGALTRFSLHASRNLLPLLPSIDDVLWRSTTSEISRLEPSCFFPPTSHLAPFKAPLQDF